MLGYPHRVGERFRMVGEHRRHLRRALDVELLGVETQPLALVNLLARADAKQDVVGLVVLAAQVVRVVGRDQGQAGAAVQPVETLVDPPLLIDAVVHDLEEEAVRAEDLAEDADRLQGRGLLPRAEVLRDLAGEAPGEADQALGVGGQHLLVDARPMVEALGVADRDQLHEIVVAALVRGQQGHVVVRLFDPRSRLVVAAPRRDVDLAAQDGLDAPVDRRVVEGHGSEHVAVVGDGERLHAELAHLVDELVDVARAVEEAVLGVEMKVDEFGVGQGLFLVPCSLFLFSVSVLCFCLN